MGTTDGGAGSGQAADPRDAAKSGEAADCGDAAAAADVAAMANAETAEGEAVLKASGALTRVAKDNFDAADLKSRQRPQRMQLVVTRPAKPKGWEYAVSAVLLVVGVAPGGFLVASTVLDGRASLASSLTQPGWIAVALIAAGWLALLAGVVIALVEVQFTIGLSNAPERGGHPPDGEDDAPSVVPLDVGDAEKFALLVSSTRRPRATWAIVALAALLFGAAAGIAIL